MDYDLILIAGVAIGVIVGGIAFTRRYLTKNARIHLALEAKRRIGIADAPEGEDAWIGGPISYDSEPLKAPLSGRPCACWVVTIEEKKTVAWCGCKKSGNNPYCDGTHQNL